MKRRLAILLAGIAVGLNAGELSGPTIEIRLTKCYGTNSTGMFAVESDGIMVCHFVQTRTYQRFMFWIESVPTNGTYRHRIHCGTLLKGQAVPDGYEWTGHIPKRVVIYADPRTSK